MVVGLEVKLSNRAGTMNLCIPYNVIEPVMEQLSAESWFSVSKNADTGKVRRKLHDSLGGAMVEVEAVLARTRIRMSEFRSLAAGDLLLTDHPSASPAVLSIEGERKYLVDVGRHGDKRAVKVRRPISPKDRV